MITLLISSLFLIFSYSSYKYDVSCNALKNTMISLSYCYPNLWVKTVTQDKEIVPLFDVNLVEETTINHFKNNMKKYVDKLVFGFYYFDSSTLLEVVDPIYTSGVRIRVTISQAFNNSYSEVKIFEIKRN